MVSSMEPWHLSTYLVRFQISRPTCAITARVFQVSAPARNHGWEYV